MLPSLQHCQPSMAATLFPPPLILCPYKAQATTNPKKVTTKRRIVLRGVISIHQGEGLTIHTYQY
jgi:hypothetical protein